MFQSLTFVRATLLVLGKADILLKWKFVSKYQRAGKLSVSFLKHLYLVIPNHNHNLVNSVMTTYVGKMLRLVFTSLVLQ